MNHRETEKRIQSAYKNIAPDIWEEILSDCDEQEGKVIVMQKKKNGNFKRVFAGVAAALVLTFGGIWGVNTWQVAHAVDSTIMLDVNPSIEIQTNKKEKVLAVNPLNEDAQKVVGDMDFTGSTLDVTVNALIGSMLRNGYISDAANSILVTVDNDDSAAGQAMEEKLMADINAILESGNVTGAVLGQTVSEDEEIQNLADQYGITTGKATLIRQITLQNTLYTFEELVPMTINELNLISESGGMKLENIQSIGQASSSDYIGEEAAKEAAFKEAGVTAEEAERIKCELDWEDSLMIYEVDFDADGYEFEYEINAKTGEILSSDKEKAEGSASVSDSSSESQQDSSDGGDASASSENVYVGEEAAKAAALAHAGVNESDISGYSCERDHEHRMVLYEIEFTVGGYEYEYEINASTGKVVKYSREADEDAVQKKDNTGKTTGTDTQSTEKTSDKTSEKTDEKTKDSSTSESTGNIDAAAAKSIALKHAGVNNVSDYKCESDTEDGQKVYEIEFTAAGYEYDYEIDASSGKILKSDKEADDDAVQA